MFHDPSRGPLVALIAGSQAGHYGLPADLLAAHHAVEAVRDAAVAIRSELADRSSAALAEQLGRALVAHLSAGGRGIPDEFHERAERAEREGARRRYAHEVLRYAEDDAWRALFDIATSSDDEVIVEHLRPAQSETLAEVRKLAPRLSGLDITSPDARLRAPRTAQEAALRLDGLAERYRALRTARRLVFQLCGGPQRDAEDTFGEVRDIRALWGERWRGRHMTTWRPWPAHTLARLAWLADVDAWMPTAAEQDAHWIEQTEDTRLGNREPVIGKVLGAA